MSIEVSFRHLDPSDSLREYASEKLGHIVDKYLKGEAEAHAILRVEKFWHIAKLTLTVRGFTIQGEEKTEDMYSSIDIALAKLERQLRRYKHKLRQHKPHSVRTVDFNYRVLSPPGGDEDDLWDEEASIYEEAEPSIAENAPSPEDFGYMSVKVDDTTRGGQTHVKVVTQSVRTARAMTVAEAIMQLDLLSTTEILVFTRADTGALNVLHRRDDGNYNLIEA